MRELKILLLRKSIDESKKKIGKWDCLNKNISNYRLREKNQKKKCFLSLIIMIEGPVFVLVAWKLKAMFVHSFLSSLRKHIKKVTVT